MKKFPQSGSGGDHSSLLAATASALNGGFITRAHARSPARKAKYCCLIVQCHCAYPVVNDRHSAGDSGIQRYAVTIMSLPNDHASKPMLRDWKSYALASCMRATTTPAQDDRHLMTSVCRQPRLRVRKGSLAKCLFPGKNGLTFQVLSWQQDRAGDYASARPDAGTISRTAGMIEQCCMHGGA